MAKRIIIDLPDETVEFDAEEVVVHEREHGISIVPRSAGGENTLGFLRLFYPWEEVRRVKTVNA